MNSPAQPKEVKADSDQLAQLINEANAEWERDCKDAFELGFFDMDRGAFIASKVESAAKKVAANTHPAIPFLHSLKISMLVDEIDELAKYHGGYDYGLPGWSHNFLEDMRGALKKLWYTK